MTETTSPQDNEPEDNEPEDNEPTNGAIDEEPAGDQPIDGVADSAEPSLVESSAGRSRFFGVALAVLGALLVLVVFLPRLRVKRPHQPTAPQKHDQH